MLQYQQQRIKDSRCGMVMKTGKGECEVCNRSREQINDLQMQSRLHIFI
jgi:hypothetical protein